MARTDLVVIDGHLMESRRSSRFLTHSDLRARAGYSANHLQAARRGRPVSLQCAKAIAIALGVDVSELIVHPTNGNDSAARVA